MFDVLPARVPWYVVGPALGVLIVAVFSLQNRPIGASGAYVQTAALLRRRTMASRWEVWYFAGMFLGGFVVTRVLQVGVEGLRPGYDSLLAVFPLGVAVPFVFVGAVLLGFGAGTAGGCTSGHGICGTAQRSPASFAVMATFMVTAIATTAALRLLTGGRL